MSEMVRKQIYIERRQEVLLKRFSKARKVSEAEIIRQALDRELASGADLQQPREAEQVLSEFIHFARSAHDQAEGTPYQWNREALYEERMNRWGAGEEETFSS